MSAAPQAFTIYDTFDDGNVSDIDTFQGGGGVAAPSVGIYPARVTTAEGVATSRLTVV